MPRFTVKASGRTPEEVLRQVAQQLAPQMTEQCGPVIGHNAMLVDVSHDELEAEQMREALRVSGTVERAALMIGVCERTFYRRMKQYGIRNGGGD